MCHLILFPFIESKGYLEEARKKSAIEPSILDMIDWISNIVNAYHQE
jgi:hypothetical protein